MSRLAVAALPLLTQASGLTVHVCDASLFCQFESPFRIFDDQPYFPCSMFLADQWNSHKHFDFHDDVHCVYLQCFDWNRPHGQSFDWNRPHGQCLWPTEVLTDSCTQFHVSHDFAHDFSCVQIVNEYMHCHVTYAQPQVVVFPKLAAASGWQSRPRGLRKFDLYNPTLDSSRKGLDMLLREVARACYAALAPSKSSVMILQPSWRNSSKLSSNCITCEDLQGLTYHPIHHDGESREKLRIWSDDPHSMAGIGSPF